MLDALRFVQGAVSRKDFVPVLTHFRIAGGNVTGYNGKLALSAPLALDVECCPNAEQLVRAVRACTDTIQFHMTPANKLSIRSAGFRTLVATLPLADFPEPAPGGTSVPLSGALLPSLARLYEYTAEDASRPWAAAVLIDGQFGYASNNVILVQAVLGGWFPFRVCLPRYAVKEMLRIGEEPESLRVSSSHITVNYSGGRWLAAQFVEDAWPDAEAVFENHATAYDDCRLVAVKPELAAALETIEPFCDDHGRVYLRDGVLATGMDADATEVAAPVSAPGCYNVRMLQRVLAVATVIDLAAYPERVTFYGPQLRGMIAGMRT